MVKKESQINWLQTKDMKLENKQEELEVKHDILEARKNVKKEPKGQIMKNDSEITNKIGGKHPKKVTAEHKTAKARQEFEITDDRGQTENMVM